MSDKTRDEEEEKKTPPPKRKLSTILDTIPVPFIDTKKNKKTKLIDMTPKNKGVKIPTSSGDEVEFLKDRDLNK
jgi:hypothetical protein